jgi:hypothetical protein
MQIDRDRFMDQGFLILRDFIPARRLDELRVAYELILERQRVLWAAQRGPQDPPGGAWETSEQPRIDLSNPGLIDRRTAVAVEEWVDERLLEVATRLLAVPDASVTEMFLMCSPPLKDFGPSAWHRDVDAAHMAPLAQLLGDAMENGPRYVQWNIPLHDDEVLWVVPCSQRQPDRPETPNESHWQIQAPIPGGLPVALRAGDAVVYNNYILHWGSSYTRKLRRTIHGGHSLFTSVPAAAVLEPLGASARAHFAYAAARERRCTDLTELALRSALHGDGRAFAAALSALQPGIGEQGRIVLSIYLDKIARGLVHQHRHDLPEAQWHERFIGRMHPITLRWGRNFARRFSGAEADRIQERFAGLDAQLRDQRLPGVRQHGYAYHDVPGLSVEELTAAWSRGDALTLAAC